MFAQKDIFMTHNTLFIINPHAGSGRAQQVWQALQPVIIERLDHFTAAVTHTPDDVTTQLQQAFDEGTRRVISVGGDGTNHAIVNAVMAHNHTHPDDPFTFGMIPAGTGQDWARGAGISLDSAQATETILTAQPRPIDVGHVQFDNEARYFLNISSAGISNDVAHRIDSAARRYPWTYTQSILTSFLFYRPEAMQIEVDGDLWFEGNAYIAAVCNGTTFGQGLIIAPDAKIDDRLLDVVVVEELALPKLLWAFPTIYTGKHTTHPRVHITRGKDIKIISQTEKPIRMDLDGEAGAGSTLIHYRVQPHALKMLL